VAGKALGVEGALVAGWEVGGGGAYRRCGFVEEDGVGRALQGFLEAGLHREGAGFMTVGSGCWATGMPLMVSCLPR